MQIDVGREGDWQCLADGFLPRISSTMTVVVCCLHLPRIYAYDWPGFFAEYPLLSAQMFSTIDSGTHWCMFSTEVFIDIIKNLFLHNFWPIKVQLTCLSLSIKSNEFRHYLFDVWWECWKFFMIFLRAKCHAFKKRGISANIREKVTQTGSRQRHWLSVPKIHSKN